MDFIFYLGISSKSIPASSLPSPAVMRDLMRGMESQPKGVMHTHHEERREVFSGPLPPPQVLAEYEKAGARDVVVKLALDANERQNKITDAKIRTSDFSIEKARKQQKQSIIDQIISDILAIFAFLLCAAVVLSFLYCANYFASKGQNIWASANAVAFLISMLGAFFWKYSYRKKTHNTPKS